MMRFLCSTSVNERKLNDLKSAFDIALEFIKVSKYLDALSCFVNFISIFVAFSAFTISFVIFFVCSSLHYRNTIKKRIIEGSIKYMLYLKKTAYELPMLKKKENKQKFSKINCIVK